MEKLNSEKIDPFITVIINVFNGQKFISRAVDSVINQSYKNIEIIVWDNCSTDNTNIILKKYKNLKYYFAEKNTSLGEARELARKKAKGSWICYLDCDDYWYQNKLKDQVQFIKPNVGLIYSGIDEKDINGKLICRRYPLFKSGFMLEEQLSRFDIDMVTPLINNKLLYKNNLGFDRSMIASEEQDLFLKLCAVSQVVTIPKIHGVSTIRKDSLTNKSISYWSEERHRTLDYLEKHTTKDKYKSAIFKARLQAKYYQARYYADLSLFSKVREIMKYLSRYRITFFVLYLISFFPFLWNFLHQRTVKTKLTDFLRINKR